MVFTDQLLFNTKQFWDITPKTNYHELVSIIISQQISFKNSRKIRSNIFTMYKTDILVPEMFHNPDNMILLSGLPLNKLEIIRRIPYDINLTTIDDLKKIKGIGIWTIKAFLLKCFSSEFNNIILCEDKWIQKNIGIIFGIDKTQRNVNIIVEQYNNKSDICKFLWRLNENGAKKLNNHDLNLTREDFV